jgi:release factor glutamine methyltransferase
LQREVRDFEPHVALVGGATGVEVYSRLVPQAHIVLQRGGWLVLEIGYSAGQRVRELLREGWTGVEIRPDLQGFDRVLIARKT